MVMDWVLIACVVALVIWTFLAIGYMIDSLLDYWRAYRDGT